MPDIIDLQFQGRPGVIGTAVLSTADGLALVDPGPTSCLATLQAGLQDRGARLSDVRVLLLTHIHLDHAGAAGTLVRQLPGCRVFVHERGAPHMADPTKLLASATRLYGDHMDRLWGPIEPVPAESLRVVGDGEAIEVGKRTVFVSETPGHASHHVTYFDPVGRVAYVGDTGGVRVACGYLIAPTPPPDIDLDAWTRSLDRIEQLNANRLVLTHFGVVDAVDDHLRRFRLVLQDTAARVRETLAMPGDDEAKVRQFTERMRVVVRQTLSEEEAAAAELAAPFGQLWLGLARYWRKRPA